MISNVNFLRAYSVVNRMKRSQISRQYISRAHPPSSIAAFSLNDAVGKVLNGIEERIEQREEKWEKNKEKRNTKVTGMRKISTTANDISYLSEKCLIVTNHIFNFYLKKLEIISNRMKDLTETKTRLLTLLSTLILIRASPVRYTLSALFRARYYLTCLVLI